MLSFVRIGHLLKKEKQKKKLDLPHEFNPRWQRRVANGQHTVLFYFFFYFLFICDVRFFSTGKTNTRAVSSRAVLQGETLSPPTPLDSPLFGNWYKKTNNCCKTVRLLQMRSTNISVWQAISNKANLVITSHDLERKGSLPRLRDHQQSDL